MVAGSLLITIFLRLEKILSAGCQQQQVRYWIQEGKKNHTEALERMQREDERDFHHQPQRNQQRDIDEEERTIIDDWEER